jgi:transcriptional regulator with XRE-family HTH domain
MAQRGRWYDGGEMKRRRMAVGMTAAELAERAGIGLSTLNRAEQGRGDVRLETLVACADVLRLSLDEYIGRVPR